MKDASHLFGERFKNSKGVFKTVPLMNNAIETEFGSDFQMLPKQIRLFFLVSFVIGLREPRLFARQPVVIKAGLAKSDDLGMLGQVAQGRSDIDRSLWRIGRMPANDS